MKLNLVVQQHRHVHFHVQVSWRSRGCKCLARGCYRTHGHPATSNKLCHFCSGDKYERGQHLSHRDVWSLGQTEGGAPTNSKHGTLYIYIYRWQSSSSPIDTDPCGLANLYQWLLCTMTRLSHCIHLLSWPAIWLDSEQSSLIQILLSLSHTLCAGNTDSAPEGRLSFEGGAITGR